MVDHVVHEPYVVKTYRCSYTRPFFGMRIFLENFISFGLIICTAALPYIFALIKLSINLIELLALIAAIQTIHKIIIINEN